MTRRDYSELINLASEMVRGVGMVSEHYDDHKWCLTTPLRERRRIIKEAQKANDQARDWAMRVKAVADRLSQGKTVKP